MSGESPVAAISERYRVLRELGRGGMGVVYLAYDLHRDMEVAIKLCTYPQLSPLHIKREFRVAASLRHPNLVEFYELIYHKHQAYFTMEYVDGTSLRRYVSLDEDQGEPSRLEAGASALRVTRTATSPSTRTLPPDSLSKQFENLVAAGAGGSAAAHPEAPAAPPPHVDFDRVRAVLGQLAAGLARLHAGGVVHRDVKPSNAMVTRDGTVKLLDFGLARDTDHLEPIDGEGHLVGTAAYLAPEYIEHLAVSPALDLYALGVVGYELCTGHPPFGGTLYSIARTRKRVAIPNAKVRNPAVPDELDALLAQLMSADPAARPSAASVAKALMDEPAQLAPIALAQQVVGRAAELAQLRRLLDNTQSPQLILITGAAGIGKSTLMQSALGHLRSEETLLWRGYCHERERVPYRAFDAIIDDLADALEASERLLDDLPFAAALARVFPALAEPLAPFVVDTTPAASNLRVERERALVAMAELIARQAESAVGPDGRPYRTVIAIENLQWIDAESVELMTMLLQLDRPMTIVATCTTEPGSPSLGGPRPLGAGSLAEDDSLPPIIAELASDHAATSRIDVTPLGEAELIAIVATAAPRLLPNEQRALAIAAAGSPYLAEVLARAADGRGISGPLSGPPPRDAAAAGERVVCAAVATSGSGASFDQLRFVTELPSRQIQSALRSLEADRVLRAMPSQSGEPTYDYYHEVLRGAAYATIPEKERRQLHAQFAGWFTKSNRPSFQALTDHWHRAGRHAEAARWALAGADASLGQLAFGAAADWYRRSLEMSQLASSDPEPAQAMVVRRARIGYAEATYLDGDIARAAALFRELSTVDAANRDHWLRRMRDAEQMLTARERGDGQ